MAFTIYDALQFTGSFTAKAAKLFQNTETMTYYIKLRRFTIYKYN